jgi:hypothetical protein
MSNIFRIVRVAAEFEVDEIQSPVWDSSDEVLVDKYWSGETAPVGRHFTVRALWSQTALYLRFTAAQTEPLVVSQKPDLSRKTKGLWDRDVCEIFIAPDPKNFRSYFEFEVAPTGEWIDLAVTQHPDRRETDFDYNSGMQAFGSVSRGLGDDGDADRLAGVWKNTCCGRTLEGKSSPLCRFGRRSRISRVAADSDRCAEFPCAGKIR